MASEEVVTLRRHLEGGVRAELGDFPIWPVLWSGRLLRGVVAKFWAGIRPLVRRGVDRVHRTLSEFQC